MLSTLVQLSLKSAGALIEMRVAMNERLFSEMQPCAPAEPGNTTVLTWDCGTAKNRFEQINSEPMEATLKADEKQMKNRRSHDRESRSDCAKSGHARVWEEHEFYSCHQAVE